MDSSMDIESALNAAARWLDEIPGVVGVGQGEEDGVPTVDVWVTNALDTPDRLPGQIHGIPVRLRESGGGPVTAQHG
jgi:hypothetical protein